MNRPTVCALLTTLLALACADATDPDDTLPGGLRIHLNGALVVRTDGSTTQGALHIHVGEYSGQFIVTPVDRDGRALDAASMRLEAVSGNPGIARFVQPAAGMLEGQIVADAEGITDLTLELRSDGGAALYTSPPIEIFAVHCTAAPGSSTAC